MRRDRIDAPGNQRGALSPAVAILAVMIFALAGLVIDGGRQLGARSRAVGYAQEAARAGAAAIVLNSDQAKIDVTKAGQAVAAFCAEVSANDPAVTDCATTKLDAEHLSVHVRIDNKTTFLGMVGVQSLEANGTGEAHAEQGIEKADDTPTIPPLTVIPASEDPGVPVNPTAVPPMPDVPCPTWTVGSPSPTPTWDPPIPFPATCTPNVTLPPPPDDPPAPPPDDPPAPPPAEPPPPPGGPPEPPPAGGG